MANLGTVEDRLAQLESKEVKSELYVLIAVLICSTFLAWQGIISGTEWATLNGSITALYTGARTYKKVNGNE